MVISHTKILNILYKTFSIKKQPVKSLVSYAQLTFQLSTATGALCSQSDTYFDSSWPSHRTFCGCAGCTWLHPIDIRGSGKGERWRQVTNGGVSKRGAGLWRVWHKATPQWVLTTCDSFQLLLLRPFHVYDICTCVAPLTGGVTSLRHFSQNSCCLSGSPLRTHKCTWHWALWTHTLHASSIIQQGTKLLL